MSNLAATAGATACVSEPTPTPVLEAIPGRLTDVGGLPIRRLLPRRQRRLVGAWCFLDSYGPLTFSSGKPMDVAPHPHIGLQTVSWLLDGELVHHDSLGLEGMAGPAVLNLMTAGKGIAHAEETPAENDGRLRGVQLWVALPDAARETGPAFEQHRALPTAELEGGTARAILGQVAGVRSPATVFSPIVAAEVAGRGPGRLTIPLERDFEHALVPLEGAGRMEGQALAVDTLYYLGCGRREIAIEADDAIRALLLGGAPFGEDVLMWWNFVARTTEEIVAAREDWEAGRRFGDVAAYRGERLPAPPFVARPVPRR